MLNFQDVDLGVSKNRGGPPKSSTLIGFSIFSPSILGFFPLFLVQHTFLLVDLPLKFPPFFFQGGLPPGGCGGTGVPGGVTWRPFNVLKQIRI